MSSDDLTRDLAADESKTTQPTMAAVFRLLNEVKLEVQNVNARFDDVNSRFDDVNSRFDDVNARLDDVNARFDATNGRLDTLNGRLDAIESRLVRDIEGVNTRMVEGFRELSHKIDALNRSRLQTEADYFGLVERITQLESKAS